MIKQNSQTSPSTTPIKDFIESTITQIKEGLPKDAIIDGIIKIEMATIIEKEAGGGLNIRVVNLGAEISENQTQKISIPIRILTETSRAEEEARKAKAEEERFKSESAKIETEKKIEAQKQPVQEPSSGVRRSDADIGNDFGLM